MTASHNAGPRNNSTRPQFLVALLKPADTVRLGNSGLLEDAATSFEAEPDEVSARPSQAADSSDETASLLQSGSTLCSRRICLTRTSRRRSVGRAANDGPVLEDPGPRNSNSGRSIKVKVETYLKQKAEIQGTAVSRTQLTRICTGQWAGGSYRSPLALASGGLGVEGSFFSESFTSAPQYAMPRTKPVDCCPQLLC